VNKGLIDRVANDDELAGVLGHEVGHIVARHSIKKLQAATGYSWARLVSILCLRLGRPGLPRIWPSRNCFWDTGARMSF